jgi:hypothetical protein
MKLRCYECKGPFGLTRRYLCGERFAAKPAVVTDNEISYGGAFLIEQTRLALNFNVNCAGLVLRLPDSLKGVHRRFRVRLSPHLPSGKIYHGGMGEATA